MDAGIAHDNPSKSLLSTFYIKSNAEIALNTNGPTERQAIIIKL
jgi:hypothetical protein